MAQASEQELKERPSQRQKWTSKMVLGIAGPIAAITKTFKIFDTVGAICSIFLIGYIGFNVVTKQKISIDIDFLVILSLFSHLLEKKLKFHYEILSNKK